ncbi:MAG TPA: hypothetical protein VFU88_16095 [Ktedonobacterales bacterium]|nr:hypothetical protein [Ktedonobacterales bacterium]
MSGPAVPPPPSNANAPRPNARAQARLAALRTGVTAFAVLAGLSCYFFLTQLGLSGWLAVGLGLIFALFVRIAATALLRDWLLAAARRQRERTSPPR